MKITNEDNMQLMARYEDNHFDLAIVDPPYGIGNWVQQTGNKRGKAVDWNNNIPSKEYFKELKRVSKEQIIWGANYYNCFNNKGGAIVWNKEVKREILQMVLSPARLTQLGHTCMKQAVKRGDKYKDAEIKKDYKAAIDAYRKAAAQNPRDPFAKYYEAAAQLNRDIAYGVTKSNRRKLKLSAHPFISR